MVNKLPGESPENTPDPSVQTVPEESVGAEERLKIQGALVTPPTPVMAKIPRGFTREKQERLLSALEARLAEQPKHYNRRVWADFEEVKASLEANPALMYSLAKMEETGGCPDMIAIESDAFVFTDCSVESPAGRRNFTYDQAIKLAKRMGVNIPSEDDYHALQKIGQFDRRTWSWLLTPAEIRAAGLALDGSRVGEIVYINRGDAHNHGEDGGCRVILRVPNIHAKMGPCGTGEK